MTAELEKIVDILMRRDGVTREEAEETLQEMRDMVAEGENPEEVLADHVGLEPDYFWELI